MGLNLSSIPLMSQANILGAAMFEHYCTPHGFEFENFNDPIEDDRRLHTYNVEVCEWGGVYGVGYQTCTPPRSKEVYG